MIRGDVKTQVVGNATVHGGLQTSNTPLLPTLTKNWIIVVTICDQHPWGPSINDVMQEGGRGVGGGGGVRVNVEGYTKKHDGEGGGAG